MSKIFHKLRNIAELIFVYTVGLPIGFLLWLSDRQMRKMCGDDWITRGEPSGQWPPKEEDNNGR